MEIAEKFSLKDHGVDTVLFNRMISALQPEDQKLLENALDTVPWDRREFIGKSIKPFLIRFEASLATERDTAVYKYAYRGMIALFHAAALTRMPHRQPLMGLTTPQSEEFLTRVINMVFFYPMYVSTAFTRNDKFVDAVCGAGVYVLAGGRKVRHRDELIAKGRALREAVTVAPQPEDAGLDIAA